MDADDDRARGGRVRARRPVRSSRTGRRGALCPSCDEPGRERASGSARPAVPSWAGAPGAGPPEVADDARVCRECGGDVARRRLLHEVRGEADSPRDHFTEQPAAGWQPCATAASGTPATRTPWPSPPGPSRAATRCSSSATGSPRRPTRTSPASRRPAPPATSWRVSDPQGMGTAATRVAASARALVAAANAANEAVIAHTAAGPGNPASCTFVAAVVDGPLLIVGWVGDSRAYWLPDAGRRPAADHRRLVRRRADRPGDAPGRRRERAAGARHHPVARHRRPRPHSAHGVRSTSTARGGCWSAPTGCGTTARRPQDMAALVATTGRHAGPEPLRWPAPWSTGPTPRAARTTSPWPSPASGPTQQDATAPPTQPPTAASTPQPAAPREEVQPDGNILS